MRRLSELELVRVCRVSHNSCRQGPGGASKAKGELQAHLLPPRTKTSACKTPQERTGEEGQEGKRQDRWATGSATGLPDDDTRLD